ncbi:MAG: CoA-binding protein [Acidobacteria bacterium]|nr:CoA-binding protein [Acidobacteriota bacterium]
MDVPDFPAVEALFEKAAADGRTRLYEHECYELFRLAGLENLPETRFIPAGSRPSRDDLDALPGNRVVLKIVSGDIIHKTDAGGVRITGKTLEEVQDTFDRMMVEVPAAYASQLEASGPDRPEGLEHLSGDRLEEAVRQRAAGILLASFVETDDTGFGSELFVGARLTPEFGPILSAGLGGVEMELLARSTRPGAAIAIAPTGLVDGNGFLDAFRGTLSYARLAGTMRGGRRLVSDEALVQVFEAFTAISNHFGGAGTGSRFQIRELEINPFTVANGRLIALDGVCSFEEAGVQLTPRPVEKIGSLLKPRSAAVIGVSAKGMNMGRIILNNIVQAGFDRTRTYIIRPNTDRIDGIACVGSIRELPEKVDLLVVTVGAAQVPGIIEEIIDHDRAQAVILIPGGLGEKEGSQELARTLKERIRQAHEAPGGGPVFLGGNSLGVISHPGRYDTMFIPETKLPKSRGDHRRRTCFISQSGAFIIANLSRMPWLDPAYALSIGNQIDLTAADILGFVTSDPEIEVIAAYMEGFQPNDGLRFAAAVREAVRRGKDVVFYKAGRTSEGRSATAGHTASVAGDYAVCAAALVEAGAFVANTFDEFSDFLQLSVRLRGKTVRGNRLAAVSNAGFESVGMADSIHQDTAELRLATFSMETRQRLGSLLASFKLDQLVDVKNPLDVTPMATDEAFASLVDTLLEDDGVDAAVTGVVPLTPAMQTLPSGEGHHENVDDPSSIAGRLAATAAAHEKPVVAVVDSGVLFDPLADALARGGLPVFRAADRAVRSLCRWTAIKIRNGRLRLP